MSIKNQEGITRRDVLMVADPTTIHIVPGFNVRKDIGDLTELENSIIAKGVVEPILCRPDGETMKLIMGQRRLMAVRNLHQRGYTEIQTPVILRKCTTEEAFDLMALENIQREDLNPVEEASLVGSYLDSGLDEKQIVEKLNKSRSWVDQRKLLTTAANEVKNALAEHKISLQAALNLARKVPYEKQAAAVLRALQKAGTNAGGKRNTNTNKTLTAETGTTPKMGKKDITKTIIWVDNLNTTPGGMVSANDAAQLIICALQFSAGFITKEAFEEKIMDTGMVAVTDETEEMAA